MSTTPLIDRPFVLPITGSRPTTEPATVSRSHLDALEAEAIFLFREVVAEFERPVLLYSVGKDSSVLLRLAKKAFAPGRLPFPLLHVDTGFKHPEMLAFRDRIARSEGVELIVHRNEEAIASGVNPWESGCGACCAQLKTKALLDALTEGRFDAAFGGARRDEEKSRAKERVLSFRDRHGRWEPRNQRPELWSVFNTRIHPGESVRAFPLSNWTEADVWEYVDREDIPVAPLYFAARRPVVELDGRLLPATGAPPDHELPVLERRTRFRSLGCGPCTGVVESGASSLAELRAELQASRSSERAGRLIDHENDDAMERKKRDGYF
ncbi:MAG: sulfate adenylyltransferase subunit CysD [Acidobacteriota bacterium]